MVRKIDANAGARKVMSALNTVSEVLRIADLFLIKQNHEVLALLIDSSRLPEC